jgi:hypothetical protein
MALDIRSEGALLLVASGKVDLAAGLVESGRHAGAFYRTTFSSCTCPDAQYRKEVCKHQRALRIQRVLDEAEAAF